MKIKIITKHDVFIDAVADDCDLIEWGDIWIKSKYEENDKIEYWNGGTIDVIVGQWTTLLIFSGDNGRLELDVVTKTI